MAEVRLGKNVVISQRAFLCTASHDYADPEFALLAKPIIISDGAWVAAEAFVGPGVTLGEGVVVAACACVTKSVDAGMVVGGNPARVLKTRRGTNDPTAAVDSGVERQQ